MSIVYLSTPGSMVRRHGESLEVWKEKERLGRIRLFDLERLVVVGTVQLSSQAVVLLLDRGVDVSFVTARGRLRGSLVSAESRNVYLRLAQFDRFHDSAFRLELSRQIVLAKVTAQQHLLARQARNHPDRVDAQAAEQLTELLTKVPTADSIESLQGFEGAAAAAYYGQFGGMLSAVAFPGRKKHPSTDPANALLSLGYVLLGNELGGRLEALGFDPAVGFFHGIRYGRSSLALDLVEGFRQPVVDRLTLRLLNLRQINPEDFEGGDEGLRLHPDALKRYFALYEEQLRAPSDGDGTPSWRERLTRQVEELREMVMTGEARPLYTWAG